MYPKGVKKGVKKDVIALFSPFWGGKGVVRV
jgi:hypothetical protein